MPESNTLYANTELTGSKGEKASADRILNDNLDRRGSLNSLAVLSSDW